MFPQYQSCSSIGLLSKLFLEDMTGVGLEGGLVKDWVVTYTWSPEALWEWERERGNRDTHPIHNFFYFQWQSTQNHKPSLTPTDYSNYMYMHMYIVCTILKLLLWDHHIWRVSCMSGWCVHYIIRSPKGYIRGLSGGRTLVPVWYGGRVARGGANWRSLTLRGTWNTQLQCTAWNRLQFNVW